MTTEQGKLKRDRLPMEITLWERIVEYPAIFNDGRFWQVGISVDIPSTAHWTAKRVFEGQSADGVILFGTVGYIDCKETLDLFTKHGKPVSVALIEHRRNEHGEMVPSRDSLGALMVLDGGSTVPLWVKLGEWLEDYRGNHDH